MFYTFVDKDSILSELQAYSTVPAAALVPLSDQTMKRLDKEDGYATITDSLIQLSHRRPSSKPDQLQISYENGPFSEGHYEVDMVDSGEFEMIFLLRICYGCKFKQ